MINFTEISDSIKATLYERARKPFTGTFMLAWFVFNWEIFATLFWADSQKLGLYSRVDYIKENYIDQYQLFWWPFIWSILLILLVPLFNLGALYVKRKFKNIEFNDINKKIPVDGILHADLLNRLNEQEKEFTERINTLSKQSSVDNKQFKDERNKRIKLSDELKESREELKRNETIISKFRKDLDKAQQIPLQYERYFEKLFSVLETYRYYHKKYDTLKYMENLKVQRSKEYNADFIKQNVDYYLNENVEREIT